MTSLSYETTIKAPVEKVFGYCTDPENIKEAWPPDIVTSSQQLSGVKGEKGSTFKILGHYAGKDQEMRMMVIERWPNSKFTTRQTEGPFKTWESIQEFEGNESSTHIKHTIHYELPRTGKLLRMVSHNDADRKIRQAMEDYTQTVKHKLEAH
ncbi:MAG: SRPBCC family protein [Nitrososphaera sp.]|jgi:ligand-binding SRPBCC domain-containing protein